MPSSPTYLRGDYNAICEVCGRQYKASQLKLRWDGLRVCSNDFEFRNAQDFVRGVPDSQAPPWTRPEPADEFVFFCTAQGSQGAADYGTADCARADDNNASLYAYCTIEGASAMPGLAIAGCMTPGVYI